MIRRGRHQAAAFALIVAGALLAGCGGDTDSNGTDDQTSASPSASSSASESPSESSAEASESPSAATSSTAAAAPEPGCTKPAAKVLFTQGSATVNVPDGPNAGQYTLTINAADDANYFDPTGGSLYTFAGAWDTDDKNPGLDLSIDDPVCNENGFLGITFEHGSVRYADAVHSECRNTLTSLNETGVAGTFECKGLDLFLGEGRPATIDASGTFTLTP
jgi:hypothetical protein